MDLVLLNNRGGVVKEPGERHHIFPEIFSGSPLLNSKTLGPDHPDLTTWLRNRAGVVVVN